MSEKPLAAVLRENKFLREVAEKAIRVRRIGMYLDKIDDITDELVKETHGTISRSGTPRMWAESAFTTAMDEFDKEVLAAFEAKMEWAKPIEGRQS